MKKEYQKIYSEFLKDLTWNSTVYEVHHIDLNHENNSFDNLVLVPRKLHRKFHCLYTGIKDCDFSKIFELNYQEPFSENWMLNFLSTKKEMQRLVQLKMQLVNFDFLDYEEDFDNVLSMYEKDIYKKYVGGNC